VPARAGLGAKMLAAAAANAWCYTGGPSDACAALALEALADDELTAAENALFGTTAAIVLANADRDEAIDAFDAELADAHRRGSMYSAPGIKLWRGYTRLRRGDLADARDDLISAFEEFERWGFAPLIRHYCAGFLASTEIERGDLAAARHALARVGEPDSVGTGVMAFLAARLDLLLAEGEATEAIATADRIARDYDWVVNPAASPWRGSTALALHRLGRTDEAIALVRTELEDARRWGAPWALGRALRILGGLEGDVDRLRQAVDVLARSPARLEYSKALAALGTSLRHARQPTEAREPLRHALELATACGANGLAEQVRAELYAAGARPRTTALQGVESLTASERRVATLAASGQTNRDIAQALFVTPKTVEVHLSNVYRKLGIRSRRELAPTLSAS
jgi:DNA-binding CsgD family transcriptional regulator